MTRFNFERGNDMNLDMFLRENWGQKKIVELSLGSKKVGDWQTEQKCPVHCFTKTKDEADRLAKELEKMARMLIWRIQGIYFLSDKITEVNLYIFLENDTYSAIFSVRARNYFHNQIGGLIRNEAKCGKSLYDTILAAQDAVVELVLAEPLLDRPLSAEKRDGVARICSGQDNSAQAPTHGTDILTLVVRSASGDGSGDPTSSLAQDMNG